MADKQQTNVPQGNKSEEMRRALSCSRFAEYAGHCRHMFTEIRSAFCFYLFIYSLDCKMRDSRQCVRFYRLRQVQTQFQLPFSPSICVLHIHPAPDSALTSSDETKSAETLFSQAPWSRIFCPFLFKLYLHSKPSNPTSKRLSLKHILHSQAFSTAHCSSSSFHSLRTFVMMLMLMFTCMVACRWVWVRIRTGQDVSQIQWIFNCFASCTILTPVVPILSRVRRLEAPPVTVYNNSSTAWASPCHTCHTSRLSFLHLTCEWT